MSPLRGEVPLGLAVGLGPPPPTAPVGRQSVWRRHRAGLATVGGLAAAAAGIVLSVTAPDVPVYVDAAGYHVGATLLPWTGPGQYANGAVVVRDTGTGAVDAGSSLTLDGRRVEGSCRLRGDVETCSISVDGSTILCDDRLDRLALPPAWVRRCDDGSTGRIPILRGHAVPVPLPISG